MLSNLFVLHCSIHSLYYVASTVTSMVSLVLEEKLYDEISKKKLLSEDLTPLKFLSVFSSHCYYIFLFFTLKFQIGKKLFLKFGIHFTEIIGRNFCDLMPFLANL